nr:leucine-rich repeat domain-containing protein [Maliibacterium massiliense]
MTYQSGTLEQAVGSANPADYTGLKVTGTMPLSAADFVYLSTQWDRAKRIDLSEAKVADNRIGSDAYDYTMALGDDGEGSAGGMDVEELLLPNTLERIEAFSLASLSKLTKLAIPDSVNHISGNAIFMMSNLTSIAYHGSGLANFSGNVFYMCYGFKTLDFSGASGLTSIDVSNANIVGIDFTGCTSLTNVNVKGQCIDFSAGKEKEWLEGYAGTINCADQRPELALSTSPITPIPINGSFALPKLQGKLKDGTDLLADAATVPSWISTKFVDSIKTNSSVSYKSPSGTVEAALDTGIGGVHTIVWTLPSGYASGLGSSPLEGKKFEVPVEVVLREEDKLSDVYYDGRAVAGGDGSDGQPFNGFTMALAYLKQNGTLHLKSNLTLPVGVTLPAGIRIVGVGAPTLTLAEDMTLAGDLSVDGVALSATKNLSIYANGHHVSIGSGVSNTAPAHALSLYGGTRSSLAGGTNLTVNGGNFKAVYGGGYVASNSADVAGDVKITIGGNAKIGKLFGGGRADSIPSYASANVRSTNLSLSGSVEVTQGVYGGGYATFGDAANVAGAVEISLSDTAKATGIYGSGYAFDSRAASAKVGSVSIVLYGGTANHVYGAGSYDEYGYYDPNPNVGVQGDVAIHLTGTAAQNLTVCGDGSLGGIVSGKSVIIYTDYGTASAPQPVSTLSHFDRLVMKGSHLLFPSGVSPNLACDAATDDATIELIDASTITLEKDVSSDFKAGALTASGAGQSGIVLKKNSAITALPFFINGRITQTTPIALTVTGQPAAAGDVVLSCSNPDGNPSLTSDQFALQNSGLKLLKKNNALRLVSVDSTELEQKDPPQHLTGVRPSKYGGTDGRISGIDETMEYALDGGAYHPYVNGTGFASGSYHVRYRETATHEASNPVQVSVPQGLHPIVYQIEHGAVVSPAPAEIAHAGSFDFQVLPEDDYQISSYAVSGAAGIAANGNTFHVSDVTKDVTVRIVCTRTPLGQALDAIKSEVVVPYGTAPGSVLDYLKQGAQLPDGVTVSFAVNSVEYLKPAGNALYVQKQNEQNTEIVVPVDVTLSDGTDTRITQLKVRFLYGVTSITGDLGASITMTDGAKLPHDGVLSVQRVTGQIPSSDMQGYQNQIAQRTGNQQIVEVFDVALYVQGVAMDLNGSAVLNLGSVSGAQLWKNVQAFSIQEDGTLKPIAVRVEGECLVLEAADSLGRFFITADKSSDAVISPHTGDPYNRMLYTSLGLMAFAVGMLALWMVRRPGRKSIKSR